MWLTLIALVVPLGIDTFAVAAALGMAGLDRQERQRVTLLFTAFEMGMPLVGVFGGALIGRAVGGLADSLAIVVLIAVGLLMLRSGVDEDLATPRLRARTRGLAAVGLGLSISIDELAIGFSLGLLGFPVPLVVLLIGVQTAIITQLGLRLGARIGERIREGAERVAGIALALLGVLLLIERLVSSR